MAEASKDVVVEKVEETPTATPVGASTRKSETFETVTFESKEYHNLACCIPAVLCCNVVSIYAGPDEATLKNDSCLCIKSQKKVPYGELAGVGEESCCCFVGFSAGALSPSGDGGQQLSIYPGTGCNADYVREIVEELKARQYHRGDAARMRVAETQNAALARIEGKLDLLLQNAGISLPADPVVEDMQR
uniref:Uncharacterized protein n=1 Tax=Aplanochytrium stocchinoi TaxID=215587 RepID=A0A7S3LHR4_9STRA|eukprot:CAMPEP_0204822690 /NCGR_PEP_ID=MMETSP1346-20131115/875_1 /ASSEMBLY_ACC=CAM_ASM_000771 /TAXON_ID=215587 /ORGANISM="Aplanochytrium stocchinoi, Strain GSBS06" /LENGTH=189 /DNA_ID=CAMNT_0051949033 /DNA_START=166 /DNA_END=735 /DNA_ORIENTATION=+